MRDARERSFERRQAKSATQCRHERAAPMVLTPFHFACFIAARGER